MANYSIFVESFMPKYMLYAQAGEGCDYTIACGKEVYMLSSSSIEEAKKETEKFIKENFSSDEHRLKKAILYEVTKEVILDIESIYKVITAKAIEKALEETAEKERMEYERLKRKFEKQYNIGAC
jgi:hypothetical protein